MRKSIACLTALLMLAMFSLVFHLQPVARHMHEAMELSIDPPHPFLESCRHCGAWRWMSADRQTALSRWTMAANVEEETIPLDVTATTVSTSFQLH